MASRGWLKHSEEITSVFKYLVCICGVGSVCPFSSEKKGQEMKKYWLLSIVLCRNERSRDSRASSQMNSGTGMAQFSVSRENFTHLPDFPHIFLSPHSDHFWLCIPLTSNSSSNKAKAWGQDYNANLALSWVILFPFVNWVHFLSLLFTSAHLFNWSLGMGG